MNTELELSVVVPARNAAEDLTRLLDALLAQTAAKEIFEVIVVDDASTDTTAEVVRTHNSARLLQTERHAGAAAARNLGIRSARGNLVALVDADCVPSAAWVERGVASFNDLEPDVIAGHIDVTLTRPFTFALVDLVQFYDQERYVSEGFGATGNLWIRKSVFERIGLFDERLERGEDQDFARRAVAAGAQLRYEPDVRVSHAARSLPAQARRSFVIGTDRGLAGLQSRVRGGGYVNPNRSRDRLAAAGFGPTRTRMLSIAVARNVCVRLPMLAGMLWSGFTGAIHRHPKRAEPVQSD